MRKSLAPSRLQKTEGGPVLTVKPAESEGDQPTTDVLLPARNKRKFTAPASVAPAKTAAAVGVSKAQVCNQVPTAKSSDQTGASAQYFAVLYTKRVANKVTT